VSLYYANITLQGPDQNDVAAYLKQQHVPAYVAPTVNTSTVVFHGEMGEQENIAAALSQQFDCPALLAMVFNNTVLLYQLYQSGEKIDAYVSSPHDDLETGSDPMPEGDPAVLCRAFGMDHRIAAVERILRRPTKPNTDFAYAANRHGELARALKLPLLAVGTSYRDIEVGELPGGQAFDVGAMVRTA
jgi:hypothetical protein